MKLLCMKQSQGILVLRQKWARNLNVAEFDCVDMLLWQNL